MCCKEPACQYRRCKRRACWILGLRRSPGGGHGNLLQYPCLENPTDRRAWRAPVQKVTKSRTRLKQLSMRTYLLSQFLLNWGGGYFFERGCSLHGFETCLFSGLVEVVVSISYELARNKGNRNSGIFRTF